MRKSRYTEEPIIGFIKQAEAGMPIKGLCRTGGFSDATLNAGSLLGLLTVTAVVSCTTGNLSLTGGTSVTHTAAASLTTTGTGTIGVTATTGNVTMADGTVYSTGTGQVDALTAIAPRTM